MKSTNKETKQATKNTKKAWYADDDTNWNTWWSDYHDPKQSA